MILLGAFPPQNKEQSWSALLISSSTTSIRAWISSTLDNPQISLRRKVPSDPLRARGCDLHVTFAIASGRQKKALEIIGKDSD